LNGYIFFFKFSWHKLKEKVNLQETYKEGPLSSFLTVVFLYFIPWKKTVSLLSICKIRDCSEISWVDYQELLHLVDQSQRIVYRKKPGNGEILGSEDDGWLTGLLYKRMDIQAIYMMIWTT